MGPRNPATADEFGNSRQREATGIYESQGVGGGRAGEAEILRKTRQLDNTTPPSEIRNGGLREGYFGGGSGRGRGACLHLHKTPARPSGTRCHLARTLSLSGETSTRPADPRTAARGRRLAPEPAPPGLPARAQPRVPVPELPCGPVDPPRSREIRLPRGSAVAAPARWAGFRRCSDASLAWGTSAQAVLELLSLGSGTFSLHTPEAAEYSRRAPSRVSTCTRNTSLHLDRARPAGAIRK